MQLIIRHLFPVIEKNTEITLESENSNDFFFVITYPNTTAKIRKMDLKNGKFVVLTNYADREKYFSLGKIKSIPITHLLQILGYFITPKGRIFFAVTRKICHVRVGEIFCTVSSLEKIRKGVYKLSSKELKD